MAKQKLTRDTIEKAAPKTTDSVIWDTEMRGLGRRISPTGNKTFVYQYRIGTRSRKYKIGSAGLSVHEVRKIALELAAKVARGTDPATEREEVRNAIIVRELADRFDAAHITFHVKPRTQTEYRGRFAETFCPH